MRACCLRMPIHKQPQNIAHETWTMRHIDNLADFVYSQGPGWEYETELPDWASVDWTEEQQQPPEESEWDDQQREEVDVVEATEMTPQCVLQQLVRRLQLHEEEGDDEDDVEEEKQQQLQPPTTTLPLGMSDWHWW